MWLSKKSEISGALCPFGNWLIAFVSVKKVGDVLPDTWTNVLRGLSDENFQSFDLSG